MRCLMGRWCLGNKKEPPPAPPKRKKPPPTPPRGREREGERKGEREGELNELNRSCQEMVAPVFFSPSQPQIQTWAELLAWPSPTAAIIDFCTAGGVIS